MSGLADKQVFLLEGGQMCMVKPVQRDLLLFSHNIFETCNSPILLSESEEIRRIDRDYQGWGEIAAFAVDMALEFYRKPPITGRLIESKYLNPNSAPLSSFFRSHFTAVSVHAWVEGLQNLSPSKRVGEYLTLKRPLLSDSKPLDYSDIIIFDFLVDDHDRFGTHNWKNAKDGRVLSWDSGLAWNYGPFHYNLDILCGPHNWAGFDPSSMFDISRTGCDRICVFRNTTITKLVNFEKASTSLGNRVEEILKRDLIYPIFSRGIYTLRNYGSLYFNVVRFNDNSFYNGLDYRLSVLLQHVDGCIQTFGVDKVLR